jgi:hypothetical protein
VEVLRETFPRSAIRKHFIVAKRYRPGFGLAFQELKSLRFCGNEALAEISGLVDRGSRIIFFHRARRFFHPTRLFIARSVRLECGCRLGPANAALSATSSEILECVRITDRSRALSVPTFSLTQMAQCSRWVGSRSGD